MALLSLRLLGPFEARLGDAPAGEFEYNKLRALLAYLAVEAGRPHRREELAGLLWSDKPDQAARDSLRQALSKLRQAIGDGDAAPPFLSITRDTIQFNPRSHHWLDVAAFEALFAACASHPHRRLETCRPCLRRLKEAAALYRGELLSGIFLEDSVLFEEWALTRREGYRRRALDAFQLLAGHHEQRGEYEQARHYARRQIEVEPWREEARRQLMRALALDGQRSAALAEYEACRRTLAEELGVEPEEETTALYRRIRDGLEKAEGPAGRLHNLPLQLTPFIGREEELIRVAECLEDPACRLLTLVGPGGIGKTRLALQAAGEQVEAFPHGVFFVRLTAAETPDLLVPAIAGALQLPFSSSADPQTQLLDFLRSLEMLLVLDGFEQLIDGAGTLLEILQAAPGVKLLVTARQPLNLQAERILDVHGLPFPPPGTLKRLESYAAVRLFLQHARRVQATFSLSPETAPHVARICQLTEGMPLAIELAVPWLRVHSCAEIAQELERSPDLLATAMQDVPTRHRSLRAVFEHSWRLLTEEERRLYRKLAVFQGGFRREAVEAVTGASIPLLRALIDKSLLGHNLAGRYTMHALLRQYAAGQLRQDPEEEAQVRDRHSRYFAAFLHDREGALKGAQQKQALQEIGEEIENVRACWQLWVEQRRTEEIGLGVEGFARYCEIRGLLQEGEEACERASQALRELARGHPGPAAEDGLTLARVQVRQASLGFRLGLYDKARLLTEESLAAVRPLGARGELLLALMNLGDLAGVRGDPAQGSQCYLKALALAQATGDRFEGGRALASLGATDLRLGDLGRARQRLAESLAAFRDLGNQWGIVRAVCGLGAVACALGDYRECRAHLREALPAAMEIQALPLALDCLVEMADLLAREGAHERALELLALAVHHPATDRDFRGEAEGLLIQLQAKLAPTVVAAAQARARTRTVEEVVEEALTAG